MSTQFYFREHPLGKGFAPFSSRKQDNPLGETTRESPKEKSP